ncbi:hypothetical protein L2E82_28636 [Cichorium intybus]|uniref:Uncharacterized protein n=1 Tax=Cichorium intybus TaxID=13427 RepID=A0ACB9CWA1_CICIN|nr:hypothetical protein L2E82_28636 [Cichorium intybus]
MAVCESPQPIFESFNDMHEFNDQRVQKHECTQRFGTMINHSKSRISGDLKRSRIRRREILPPISIIGRQVCFESYRSNGRLILREVKIQNQELLHAYREDGRLKLKFVQYDDDVENGQKIGYGIEADDITEKNEIREEPL